MDDWIKNSSPLKRPGNKNKEMLAVALNKAKILSRVVIEEHTHMSNQIDQLLATLNACYGTDGQRAKGIVDVEKMSLLAMVVAALEYEVGRNEKG